MASADQAEITPLTMSELSDTTGDEKKNVPNVPKTYPKLVEFEDQFKDPEEKIPISAHLCKALDKKTANFSVKRSVLGILPIIETIRTYKVKEDLPSDIIAGLTSGVMMIPQGMAFAALSTLPPIVGLYISFFASIGYAILGTGRQVSWGCIAVLSIMMGTVLDKYDQSQSKPESLICVNGTVVPESIGVDGVIRYEITNDTAPSSTSSSSSEFSSDPSDPVTARRMEVASGVTLVAGIVVIVASRIGLSRVSNFLSNSLITGFTVGIAFHVCTSQLKEILGVTVPRQSGIASIVKTWIEVAKKIPDTNVATLIMSLICILVIYLVKRFVNEKYKAKLRVPVPIDLFVAVAATLVADFGRIHKEFNVKVVGDVPVGLPSPKIPDLSLSQSYIGDGLIIAIVAFTQTLAVSKTFGLEHGYAIDPAQEMLASGIVNTLCGIFSGYIAAGSVSRSVVQNAAGGRTQLASLVAATLVLLVILLMGPYFYYLPKCVLSAIIMVSLRSMFLKLLTIPDSWRRSPFDCAVWVFSCTATVFLNPDLGLLASVVFSILLVVLRSMWQPVSQAGRIQTGPLSAELRSVKGYSSATITHQVCVIKVQSPIYFVNSDAFVEGVYSKTGIDPAAIKKEQNKSQTKTDEKIKLNSGSSNYSTVVSKDEQTNPENGHAKKTDIETNGDVKHPEKCSHIILDAAQMSFIDLMGVQALQLVITEMASVGINVSISSVPEGCISILRSSGFWKKHGERLFVTVNDALAALHSETNQGSCTKL